MKKKVKYILALIAILLWASFNYCTNLPLSLEENIQIALNTMELEECHILEFEEFDSAKRITIDPNITEKEVTTYIEHILRENAYRQIVSDRNVVCMGDLAVADYSINYNGEQIKSVVDASIRVGSGEYDEYLEEAIQGMEENKEYVVKWLVPENVENSDLAGKEVEICVVIKEIYDVIVPTVEEYALKIGYNSSNEYIVSVKESLYQEKQKEAVSNTVEDIIKEIIRKSKFKINEDVIADNAMYYYYQHKSLANTYNMSLDEYVQSILNYEGDIYELCYQESLYEIQRHLVIGRYAKEKNVVLSEQDVDKYCKSNNINRDEMTGENFLYLKYNIIEAKICDMIIATYIDYN